jgi:hypothetical protein
VEVKYNVPTWGPLKTEREATASSETSACINLTTELYFQEGIVLDVDLIQRYLSFYNRCGKNR